MATVSRAGGIGENEKSRAQLHNMSFQLAKFHFDRLKDERENERTTLRGEKGKHKKYENNNNNNKKRSKNNKSPDTSWSAT